MPYRAHVHGTTGYNLEINTVIAENTQLKEDISKYQQEISGYKLEMLGSKKDLERIQQGYNQDIIGYEENITSLNSEISRLKESLANTPDPMEFAKLQGKYEEIENHNITLRAELEKAGQRYDNYMAQMQTLIKQKSIEAPGSKKPWWRFW